MDKIQELKKLKELLDNGIISEQEYNSLKSKILDPSEGQINEKIVSDSEIKKIKEGAIEKENIIEESVLEPSQTEKDKEIDNEEKSELGGGTLDNPIINNKKRYLKFVLWSIIGLVTMLLIFIITNSIGTNDVLDDEVKNDETAVNTEEAINNGNDESVLEDEKSNDYTHYLVLKFVGMDCLPHDCAPNCCYFDFKEGDNHFYFNLNLGSQSKIQSTELIEGKEYYIGFNTDEELGSIGECDGVTCASAIVYLNTLQDEISSRSNSLVDYRNIEVSGVTYFCSQSEDASVFPFTIERLSVEGFNRKPVIDDYLTIIPLDEDLPRIEQQIIDFDEVSSDFGEDLPPTYVPFLTRLTDDAYTSFAINQGAKGNYLSALYLYPSQKNVSKIDAKTIKNGDIPFSVNSAFIELALDFDSDGKPDYIYTSFCCKEPKSNQDCDYTCGLEYKKSKGIWVNTDYIQPM